MPVVVDASPQRRAARQLLRLAMLVTVLILEGCTSIALTSANVPAAFGHYARHSDLPYGTNKRQRLDVYVPQSPAAGGRPVVVFFYGGGWSEGAKEQYRFVADALTSRGYVVVVPDYRLYPQVRFPAFIEDAALAVRWTHDHVAEFNGDPGKLVLLGHSAGAHIAAMLTFDEHFLTAVGGDQRWISGFIGLSGPYDFLPIIDPVVQKVFSSLTNLKESQPINFVGGGEPPVLLMHGEADKRVAPANSTRLAERIREQQGSVSERYFPGMSHGGILAPLSVYLRGGAPVLDEISRFVDDRTRPVNP
jgi:acetyl esterase/lipase